MGLIKLFIEIKKFLFSRKGFLSAIAASLIAAIILLAFQKVFFDSNSNPSITHINGISIKNWGTPTKPCEVFLEDNLINGKKGKGGKYIYTIVESIKDKKCLPTNLYPGGTLDFANDQAGLFSYDWADYFSIGDRKYLSMLFRIFVVQTAELLKSIEEVKHIKTLSEVIFIKVTQPGAYKDKKTAQIFASIPEISPTRIVSSPQLYANIYVGREYFKQDVTSARSIIANLYYSGFRNRAVKAEVDWGEGQGWEDDVDLHREGEYYQILHIYEHPGKKEVRYRVTDEKGQWAEAIDSIVIKEGAE